MGCRAVTLTEEEIRALRAEIAAELLAAMQVAMESAQVSSVPALATAAACDAFLADAGAIGAAKTRRAYRTALRALVEFLPAGLAVADLRPEHLLPWPTWLIEKRQLARRTVQVYLAALSRFLDWCTVQDYLRMSARQIARLNDGIRRARKSQKPPQLVPHPPTDEALRRLLNHIRQADLPPPGRGRLEHLRNIAIVETLRCTGLRVAELCSLTVGHLKPDRSAWIIGKGSRERQIFWDGPAWAACQTYLDARQGMDAASGAPRNTLPLFARHDKRVAGVQPLRTEAVETLFRELSIVVGERITPHAMRHWFATQVYRGSGDLAITQTALGHESPVTTRIYAKLGDGALRTAHGAAFNETGKGKTDETDEAK